MTVHLVEEVASCSDVVTGTSNTNTLSGYPVVNRRRSWKNFRVFNRELHSSEMSFAPAGSDSISLIISVEDTGVGIPFEAQSRVFTPFMQVGPSIARIHGGTGIGLSISKCLVGLMQGEIGFASKPNVGSTFTFTAVLARLAPLAVRMNHQILKILMHWWLIIDWFVPRLPSTICGDWEFELN